MKTRKLDINVRHLIPKQPPRNKGNKQIWIIRIFIVAIVCLQELSSYKNCIIIHRIKNSWHILFVVKKTTARGRLVYFYSEKIIKCQVRSWRANHSKVHRESVTPRYCYPSFKYQVHSANQLDAFVSVILAKYILYSRSPSSSLGTLNVAVVSRSTTAPTDAGIWLRSYPMHQVTHSKLSTAVI